MLYVKTNQETINTSFVVVQLTVNNVLAFISVYNIFVVRGSVSDNRVDPNL